MEEFGVKPEVCEDEPYFTEVLASVMATVCSLLTEILSIQVPSLKEYALALQAALVSSWTCLLAWASALTLILSPIWQLLRVLTSAVWPHVKSAATSAWRFQASLPLTAVVAEVTSVVMVILVILLRRFIVRRRYIPRVQRSVHLFRTQMNRRYLAFTAAVERNFRVSAKAFPHVVYWTLAGLFAWFAPDTAGNCRDKMWVGVTASWPSLYALYLALSLRSQNSSTVVLDEGSRGRGPRVLPGQPAHSRRALTVTRKNVSGSRSMAAVNGREATPTRGSTTVLPHDVDRVLMYWVVFTMARCCSVLAGYVPFAASVLQVVAPPIVRTMTFLAVVWMHLPGPGSGLQVVYAFLEPLVHTYVKDLRPKEEYTGVLRRIQDLLVFLGFMTKEHAEVLGENVADSWMLLPVPLFLFTPGFITNLGCLYTGLLVPALNSTKALGKRSDVDAAGNWEGQASPAGGASARVRWLTYWVAFGGWWHISLFLSGFIRLLPFANHFQLVLLLWLQVPLFRGAGRVMDFGEECLMRWSSGGIGAKAAAGGRESGG